MPAEKAGPNKAKTTVVGIRLTDKEMVALDLLAKAEFRKRADMGRCLILKALEPYLENVSLKSLDEKGAA